MLEMQQVALINYEEKLVCKLFSTQEMKTITSTRIKGTKLKDFYHVIMRKQEIKNCFWIMDKNSNLCRFFCLFF